MADGPRGGAAACVGWLARCGKMSSKVLCFARRSTVSLAAAIWSVSAVIILEASSCICPLSLSRFAISLACRASAFCNLKAAYLTLSGGARGLDLGHLSRLVH